MDRQSALEDLQNANDSDVRLTAARYLYSEASVTDRRALAAALRRETNSWAREALRDAIARLDLMSSLDDSAALPEASTGDDARVRAFDEAIRVCLHEIRPIVGDLRSEIGLLAGGPTPGVLREIDRLTRLLQALENLAQAGGPPEAVEFDVSELVRTVAESELNDRAGQLEFAGPRSLITEGDPYRIELALRNGVRNALDAVSELGVVDSPPILLSWGNSDDEIWIVVLDRGVGLPPFFEKAFELGRTTKSKSIHFGLGLTIARRAARSLGGDVTIAPRDEGGAGFELKWPGPAVQV